MNSPTQKLIIKESLDRKAANYLRRCVLTGELAPGERITEQIFASRLELSRGTVRAALQRLSLEGLIVQNVYSSWEVMRLTAEDADELYTLRASLEGLAGRLAVARIDENGKELISKAFRRLVDVASSGSENALVDADFNLHRSIVELSGNKRLINYYTQVEGQMRMYMSSVHGVLPSLEAVADAHEPMVEALLACDAKAAEELLVEHCEVYGTKLVDRLRL